MLFDFLFKPKYMNKEVQVLFVCMGNICRSPTAEGVFRHIVEEEGLADKIGIDSAGTHAYHVGEKPDPRARETALQRGIDLSTLRARRVLAEDFATFDYILAMDEDNYAGLSSICPAGMEAKLHLFLSFAPGLRETEVPDPYYGGQHGFDRVFDMVAEASRGLLQDIQEKYLSATESQKL